MEDGFIQVNILPFMKPCERPLFSHDGNCGHIHPYKLITEWLDALGDEAFMAVLLDRLLYYCEIIRLSGTSFRMKNRKTIFSNHEQDIGT